MKKTILLLAAIALVSTASFAQGKLGHINAQEVLQIMPERATAEKAITDYRKSLDTRMQTLSSEYENKVMAFQGMAQDTPESTVQDMRNEILAMEDRIQKFQVSAESDLMKKNEELLQPMLKKLQDAIDAVGKENGFTYIFDLSNGSIVYQSGEDIGPLVKAKLGIQ